jgi:hypothetical protein
MPFGTAQGRLKKRIFFSLVQRLGLDICFRCGKRILTAEDLSCDHKKPWLDISLELFWDLDNIAFSHRGCNSAAFRVSNKLYFTQEAFIGARRKRNAATKRKSYTPENRHQKWVTTGQ